MDSPDRSIEIVACETLKSELEAAMKKVGLQYPIHWLGSELHNVPQKLHEEMQRALDECHSKTVLLAMGFCSNSVAGLRTGDFTLVIPRCDDCISLLLDPSENRGGGSYYMTDGWLYGDGHLYKEYLYTVEEYGEEEAREIYDIMFHNYSDVALLDTGCFDLPPVEELALWLAGKLGLGCRRVPGSLDRLCRLLTGPWDGEEVIAFPPNSTVSADELTAK